VSTAVLTRLDRADWVEREARHRERADASTADHRGRSARAEKHPVDDFLFTYYSYKPAVLRRWHPGADVALADAAREPRAEWRWYESRSDGSVVVDSVGFVAQHRGLLGWIGGVLQRTAANPAQFGCFGLHEWAMTYRTPDRRHEVPLRLGQSGTDEVVEALDLKCTHFDAFRFFTPDAVPRNRLAPTPERATEQAGCLHAGMDVYKWAVKLGPLVPGELLLDAFELARDIRRLDMAASPYDLAAWGLAPVTIETAEGKSEYVIRQRAFAERSGVLRAALLDIVERVRDR
jgi:hypothetical protein